PPITTTRAWLRISVKDVEMGFGGLAAVDRQDVLRACRHGADAVEFGTEHHEIAWFGKGGFEGERARARPGDVHEEIQGGRGKGNMEPKLEQSGMKVVAAVVVVVGAAKQSVALVVAWRHHSVMAARRSVPFEGEDRAVVIGIHLIAFDRKQAGPCRATM